MIYNVFDKPADIKFRELNEVDVFNLDLQQLGEKEKNLQLRVDRQIEIHEDDRFADEDHTDDIFYSHEWDTGEDLERQTNGNAP